MIVAPFNLATSCGQIEKQGQRGLGASSRGSAPTACRRGPLGTPHDDLEQIPSHSRNLDLLDELELFLLGFARPIEIPPQLNIHPEIRRRAEILGEPQRSAWSYSPALVHQFVNSLVRDANRVGEIPLRHRHRDKEFFEQHLPRMCRFTMRWYSHHGFFLSSNAPNGNLQSRHCLDRYPPRQSISGIAR
jgi:hypothetical protein